MITSDIKPTEIDLPIPQWKPATWEDYLSYYDNPDLEDIRVFFYDGYLWVDMGNEGINHSRFNRLLTMLFLVWFSQKPEQIVEDLGGCVIEKPKHCGGAPDLILYIGEGSPKWKKGEPRRINLDKWRVPDLVGEISDTTLATDLDEKKQLYAQLKIPEYWAIDIKGGRVFAFRLQENGQYRQVEVSVALEGLPIAILEQTLAKMEEGTNMSAAQWFAEQIQKI